MVVSRNCCGQQAVNLVAVGNGTGLLLLVRRREVWEMMMVHRQRSRGGSASFVFSVYGEVDQVGPSWVFVFGL